MYSITILYVFMVSFIPWNRTFCGLQTNIFTRDPLNVHLYTLNDTYPTFSQMDISLPLIVYLNLAPSRVYHLTPIHHLQTPKHTHIHIHVNTCVCVCVCLWPSFYVKNIRPKKKQSKWDDWIVIKKGFICELINKTPVTDT